MKFIILVSFMLLLVSCWKRNDLPDQLLVDSSLWLDPGQVAVSESSFNVDAGGESYEIQPLYEYDLHGLVVSYQHHNAKFGLHKSWGDHLNVADFCVVWGDNVKPAQLNKLNFWNGQFTCNVETRDMVAWNSFEMDQLSNNHLIASDELVRSALNDVKIGDQIRIRGKLVNYKYPRGGQRSTSTTRTDTGNGACETIYVERVDIINAYTGVWRKIMYGAAAVLILFLTFYVMSPYKGK